MGNFNYFRNSILDTIDEVDISVLASNVRLIAESALAYMFEIGAEERDESNKEQPRSMLAPKDVNVERLNGFLRVFGSAPRPMATNSVKVATELRDVCAKYATGRVALAEVHPVDLQLYGILGNLRVYSRIHKATTFCCEIQSLDDKLVAHVVKPAVFELLLAGLIGAYLYLLYYVAQNAQFILETSVLRLKKSIRS